MLTFSRYSSSLLFVVLAKSVVRQPISYVLLIVSLLIATSGLSAVLIINQSAKQSYQSGHSSFINEATYTVLAKEDNKITKENYATLRRQGFTQLIAVARLRTHLYNQSSQQLTQRSVDITAIDSHALVNLSPNTSKNVNRKNEAFSDKQTLLASNLIPNASAVFAHPKFIQSINGQELFTLNNIRLPELVAADIDQLGNDIVMDISTFYTIFDDANLDSLIWTGALDSATKQSLIESLPNSLTLLPIENNSVNNTESFHLNLLAMALLMFTVCLFIVLNTAQLIINDRMSWLKVCRQLGFSRTALIKVQCIELLLLVFIVTLIGVVIGVKLANLASPLVQTSLESLYSVQVGYGNVSFFALFLQVIAVSFAGVLLAFVMPFQQLNQKLSYKQISDISWRTPAKQSMMFLAACLVFSIGASLIFNTATSLVFLLFGTALLIFAGCACLMASYPYFLEFLIKSIPSKWFLVRISLYQSIELSGKTKVACCAFFIAATSNIGMNLMVDSFRGATLGWLDKRLAAEHYLYYSGPYDLTTLWKEQKISTIDITPRYQANAQISGVEGKVTESIDIYSYPTSQDMREAMVFSQQLNDSLWSKFESGKGIFVNQQAFIRKGLSLGQEVMLSHEGIDEKQYYKILGVFYDYGNSATQALLPLRYFQTLKTNNNLSIQSDIFAINGLKNHPNQNLFIDWLDSLDINAKTQLYTTESLLELSIATFDRTFLITDGLNIITLLVASLSLACSIILLLDTTRPNRMLLRSMGISNLKNQFLTYIQYVFLCLVALIFAIPFGIVLSSVLINQINYQAFQWTYPLVINPEVLLNVFGLSLLVVSSVVLVPILNIAKRPLISDIRLLN